MAQAYRCDRCKTFFVKDEEYHQKVGKSFTSGTMLKLTPYSDKTRLRRDFDLCLDCQEGLKNWFYNAITECEKEPKRLIWHPYPNEKPTVNGDYDVSLCGYNFVVRAYYDVGRDEWTNVEDFERIETVTAWTDLLEVYKEGENK